MRKKKDSGVVNMFLDEMEAEAITRIQKFAKIASVMRYEIGVGFSGGKDSLVVYDLCKRAGIECKFYFNHALEDLTTLRYIRENFPDVIWRRTEKGFFEYLQKEKKGMFPTFQFAWCCEAYKHNAKFIDNASIVGIRSSESPKRANRRVFMSKNKTFMKHNKATFNEYFEDRCQGTGAPNKILLNVIVDWSDDDVWNYIHKYDLPINPLYSNGFNRVGCMICPKTNFSNNFPMLMKYPKLIDCVINARLRSNNKNEDWIIKMDNTDYANDKVYYVCRWLNHSFMPFTKKQEELYRKFREYYDSLKNKKI